MQRIIRTTFTLTPYAERGYLRLEWGRYICHLDAKQAQRWLVAARGFGFAPLGSQVSYAERYLFGVLQAPLKLEDDQRDALIASLERFMNAVRQQLPQAA